MEWDEILKKRETYTTQQFKNEVMAEFADVGMRPITRRELERCCKADLDMSDKHLEQCEKWSMSYPIYAGLDWGTGTQGYTVLTLGSYFGGSKFRIFYVKRFEGREADPLYQLSLIAHLLRKYNVKFTGADYGFGFVQNAKLQDAFAESEMLYCQFYNSHNPKKRFAYSKGTGRYVLHRSQMMSNLFNIMKSKQIDLPKWEAFERPYGHDILNIVAVYDEVTRLIRYDHSPDRPDDTFHSILYCFLASFFDVPRADLLGLSNVDTIS
jgi:hypothetical protein